MIGGFALFRVRGDSMLPNLRTGDYVLVRSHDATRRPLMRGCIVVAKTADRIQIKRVVGLPGERVTFTEGTLLIDGQKLAEPYLRGLPPYLGLDYLEYQLERDEYFLMGDNRAHSADSRHYGPVRRSWIDGRAIVRVLPLPRWGRL